MKKNLAISITLICIIFSQAIYAQTTEFTYQGRLVDSSLPANGNYDFEFSQFDALTSGTQIGSTNTINSVAVTNGVFTVRLDFGNVFGNGTNRFLEINVRQTGNPTFTPLTPRQPITSTPYALKSLHSNTTTLANNSNELGGFKPADFTFTNDPRLSDNRNPLPGSANYVQNIASSATIQPTSGFNISGTGFANSFDTRNDFRIGGISILRGDGSDLYFGIGAGPTGQTNIPPDPNMLMIGNDATYEGNDLTGSTAIGYRARITTSNTIQLGENDVTTVRIGKLANFNSDNSIPLCLNSVTKEIARCSNSLVQVSKKQLESQQKLINKQQKQIESLKALVCSQNPTAELCLKTEEKQ